tara:strand:- start:1838 stop:1954 length:117 start_codon:yes stop_codon:yes gene_type:complete
MINLEEVKPFADRYIKRRIELMYSRVEWDLSGRKGSWK